MSIQNDKVPVRVKFVKPRYEDGRTEILALFVGQGQINYRLGSTKKYIICYAHFGQHSSANKSFLRRKLATKEEYLPLLKELESLGYIVTVVNKEKKLI